MILWARPCKDDFEQMLEKAYSILSLLKQAGSQFAPNYLTGLKKANTNQFDLSYENLAKIIKKGRNVELGVSESTLGYKFSFFSSMNNEYSSGISMSIGISNPKFNNTLIVNFPERLALSSDDLVVEKVINMFMDCCIIFKPYWGCISNNLNIGRYDRLFGNKVPTSIHWMNYFGIDIVDLVGRSKVEIAPLYSIEKTEHGYFLRMQKYPLSELNSNDIEKQENLNLYFGFNN